MMTPTRERQGIEYTTSTEADAMRELREHQWEREAIGERTATAMQHKASQGEYTGGWALVAVVANGTLQT